MQYTEHIQRAYPDFLIKKVDINDIGQNNYVLIINNSVVFRFPKYNHGVLKLKKETHILNSLNKNIETPIPNPTFQSFEPNEIGKVFIGYNMIKGSPFWRKSFLEINNESIIKRIAIQLVSFLKELHSTQIKDITDVAEGIDKSPRIEMPVLFEKVRSKLFPYMRADAQFEITKSFENYLNEVNFTNERPSLIHGDFGASNILWDSDLQSISGIVDFGEAGVGDPAYDFAGLLSSYGDDFLNICLNLYPNGKEYLERVYFYKSTFALQEALHGFENNDVGAFENGIKEFI